jgi:pimeloyl-ACP methyl ester carboxylesterase
VSRAYPLGVSGDPVSGRTLQIAGPGGRRLDVELSGPAEGRPLSFHNGTPMAGMMFAPMVAQGAERGVRHSAYSRPGYGGSERDAGRTVADCALDVAAIADELSIERLTSSPAWARRRSRSSGRPGRARIS